jgi:hypothetical protein
VIDHDVVRLDVSVHDALAMAAAIVNTMTHSSGDADTGRVGLVPSPAKNVAAVSADL